MKNYSAWKIFAYVVPVKNILTSTLVLIQKYVATKTNFVHKFRVISLDFVHN